MPTPQNYQTHSNNLSANCWRIVWVCLTILSNWRWYGEAHWTLSVQKDHKVIFKWCALLCMSLFPSFHLSSQEPCIIWLSFLVLMNKMIISQGVFFIFILVLVSWAATGVKGQKIMSLTPYLRNCTSYDYGFWYTCVKWSYLRQFFGNF